MCFSYGDSTFIGIVSSGSSPVASPLISALNLKRVRWGEKGGKTKNTWIFLAPFPPVSVQPPFPSLAFAAGTALRARRLQLHLPGSRARKKSKSVQSHCQNKALTIRLLMKKEFSSNALSGPCTPSPTRTLEPSGTLLINLFPSASFSICFFL